MAKKKKNRSNDTRGYATTNSQSATTSLPSAAVSISESTHTSRLAVPAKEPVTKSGLKSVAFAPASRVQITPDVQQTMESLLRALHSLREGSIGSDHDTTSVTTTLPPLTALENIHTSNGVDIAKLRRRVAAIYDSLMEYGFDYEQIQEAISACSTNVTLTLALDWLCYNIPTSDLPTLFTEGLIRESEMKKHNDSVGVTLIPAIRANPLTSAIAVSPPIDHVSNMALDETNTSEAVQDDERWNSEQKSMLLAKYEFECSSEDDDESHYLDSSLVDNSVRTNGNFAAVSSMVNSEDSHFIENTSSAPPLDDMTIDTPELLDSPDPSTLDIRSRLASLRGELNALEDDLRNEANNYMRSKDEIKELKRTQNKLRKEVSAWEAKLRRQTAEENRLLTVESGTDVELEDDHEAGLFSIFEEAEENQEELQKETSVPPATLSGPDSGIYIPDDAVPAGWTGQTPKGYLQEFCRKEKFGKPFFEKLALNGCRLYLQQKTGNKAFEEPGPHTNYLGVQHYLSLKALYEMTPSLPLYRLFPPFYRDTWVNWINCEKREELNQSDLLANIRSKKIDALMECIRVSSASCSAGSKVALVENYSQRSSNQFSKFKAPIADSRNGSPTEQGTVLLKEFCSRKDSQSYMSMLSIRSELPIFRYRERILETIANHPVTILCADTGTLCPHLPRMSSLNTVARD